jgi:hypothetical protein
MSAPADNNPHFKNLNRAPYELGHLLKKLPANFDIPESALTPDDKLIAEAATQHAENANDTLMRGLDALGHLMFVAGQSDDWAVESRQLADLGCLISHMAIESQFLQEANWSIRDTLSMHAELAAKTGGANKRTIAANGKGGAV